MCVCSCMQHWQTAALRRRARVPLPPPVCDFHSLVMVTHRELGYLFPSVVPFLFLTRRAGEDSMVVAGYRGEDHGIGNATCRRVGACRTLPGTQRVGDGTVLIAVRLRPMGGCMRDARSIRPVRPLECDQTRRRDPTDPIAPARRFPLRREGGARLVAVVIVSCEAGPAMAWPSLLASSFSRRAPGFHSSNFSPNWLRKSCGLRRLERI